jgi:hypothetical protein
MWAVRCSHVPWGEPRVGPLEAGRILHIMREPAPAVCSIAYTDLISEPWRSRWVDIPVEADPIERAIWSYYGWNRLIMRNRPTHNAQIENIESTVETIVGTKPKAPSIEWLNSRKHPNHSTDEIKSMTWIDPLTAVLWDHLQTMYEAMAQ